MSIHDFIANGQLSRLFDVQSRDCNGQSTFVGFSVASAAGRTLSLLACAEERTRAPSQGTETP